jgi:hypothetical protein
MIQGIMNMCDHATNVLIKKELITNIKKDEINDELFKFAMAILKVASDDYQNINKEDDNKIIIPIKNKVFTIDTRLSGGYSVIIKKGRDKK